jgi:hypothetical protein
MNKTEAAELLTIAGAFDRWIAVNDATATAWSYVLSDVSADLAKAAVLEHYSGPDAHKQLMPADIIKAVEREARLTRPLIEADVRSAKARGLVSKDWPDAQVLPEDVRARLQAAREDARAEMLALGAPDRISRAEFDRMEGDAA